MEQQRAINALEPFLALSKSANSPRAAADLVTQATSAPNTFVFAELLQTANIQSLTKSQEYAPFLRQLEIFAWGTVNDYKANPSLPKLNDQQSAKLQLLTLLPLVSKPAPGTHIDPLSYQYLQTELGLSSSAELESLIQTALYSSLIEGHLDPLRQRVAITAVAPLRDLAPGSTQSHIQQLTIWETNCTDVLGEIDANIEAIKRRALQKSQSQKRQDQVFEEEVAKTPPAKDLGKMVASGDAMDIDDSARGGSATDSIASNSAANASASSSRGVKRNLKTMFSR